MLTRVVRRPFIADQNFYMGDAGTHGRGLPLDIALYQLGRGGPPPQVYSNPADRSSIFFRSTDKNGPRRCGVHALLQSRLPRLPRRKNRRRNITAAANANGRLLIGGFCPTALREMLARGLLRWRGGMRTSLFSRRKPRPRGHRRPRGRKKGRQRLKPTSQRVSVLRFERIR